MQKNLEPSTSTDLVPAKGSWLVWIVPFVALCIAAYLVTKEFAERGPLVTITFQEGSGLEANKTRLLSRGVTVGTVERVSLSPDLGQVVVQARLDSAARSLAREQSRFWIVRPEISVSGVHGLDTLMSGPTINVDPGGGAFHTQFEGLATPPRNSQSLSEYILRSDRRISVHPGVPVLFRGLAVGSVAEVQLSPDASEIWTTIHIDAPFERLIRPESRFWDAGGVNLQVNLLGAKLRTGSMESILSGGVEFATPPEAVTSPIAEPGTMFELFNEADEKWLKWKASMPPESALSIPSQIETLPSPSD